jgi:hypothetical protein
VKAPFREWWQWIPILPHSSVETKLNDDLQQSSAGSSVVKRGSSNKQNTSSYNIQVKISK